MFDNQLYCDVTFIFEEETEEVKSPATFGDFEFTPFPTPPQIWL